MAIRRRSNFRFEQPYPVKMVKPHVAIAEYPETFRGSTHQNTKKGNQYEKYVSWIHKTGAYGLWDGGEPDQGRA
jgi:hypothetical protein